MSDAKRQTWIRAGFTELARAGIDGVRVEVLAKNLGVTKGGFYRRFRDRAALLEAMLADWREGRVAALEQQASLGGEAWLSSWRSGNGRGPMKGRRTRWQGWMGRG